MSSSGRRIIRIELKVVPMIDYVLSLNGHCIIIQDIRTNESTSRSLMNDQCTFSSITLNHIKPILWFKTK
jgi:hypothetical protein